MKTFVVYSKKPLQFISSFQDISKLKFIKYGFNWWYFIDFVNIFYALKRNFIVIAVLYVAVYFLLSGSPSFQLLVVLSFSFFAYVMEGYFLKRRKYIIVGTIEAKNQKQAKEIFLKEYIVDGRRLSF